MAYEADIADAAEDIREASNGLSCVIFRGEQMFGPVPCVLMGVPYSERIGQLMEGQTIRALVAAGGLSIVPDWQTDEIAFIGRNGEGMGEEGIAPAQPAGYVVALGTRFRVSNEPLAPDGTAIVHDLRISVA